MNDAPSPASASRAIGGFTAALLAAGLIGSVIAAELLFFPSLRIWNKSPDEFQRGVDAYRKLDYDSAIRHFSAGIARHPTHDMAYNWRGMVYRSKGDNARALADFDTSIRLNPRSAGVYYNRASVHHAERKYDAALADYDEAIRIAPAYAMAYNYRGSVRRATGDHTASIADYTAAIRLDGTNARFLGNRANAYVALGDFARAIEDFENAIKVNPNEESALNNLAWLWSTCSEPDFRNGSRAIEVATKACELRQWKDSTSLDTLAAAYAEAGKFDQAVKWQLACLEMGTLSESQAAEARDRLALYQTGKPYHLAK